MLLPGRRLDDLDWYRAQHDGGFGRAGGTTVFEPAGRAWAGHRLSAFDPSADRFVRVDEVANGGDVDPFFGAGADGRNVDTFHQRRPAPVGDLDDGQPATNTGINAKHF